MRLSRHPVGRRVIDPLVHEVREQRRDAGSGSPALDALSKHLLAPVADVLATHDRLIVVPDGSLNRLPFHRLTWRGQPLCTTHVVTVLPSAALALRLAATRPSPHSGVTVIGNPANMSFVPAVNGVVLDPDPKLLFPAGPLPYAEVEAELVASAFRGAVLQCGEAATLDAFLPSAAASRVIHLATHGNLIDIVPSLSCILLANGDHLAAEHLTRERALAADLVVLSACQTGAAPVSRGNDTLSLARALLTAGARTVIVTLWQVDDVSTALLMWRFYENCAAGVPVAAALGQAQVWLRDLRVDEARQVTAAWLAKPLNPAVQMQILRLQFALFDSRSDDARPYEAPHHWAAFACIGLPDVSL
jgi:CHAT domain-containing protein